VVGLGYRRVAAGGAPVAHFDVVGYDQKRIRIHELRSGVDRTLEIDAAALRARSDSSHRQSPRPVGLSGDHRRGAHPDRFPSHPGPESSGKRLDHGGKTHAKGGCIVFESRFTPAVTEEVCVPFWSVNPVSSSAKTLRVGYSPERINPGDKIHTLEPGGVKGGCPVRYLRQRSSCCACSVYGKVVPAGHPSGPHRSRWPRPPRSSKEHSGGSQHRAEGWHERARP